MIRMSSCVYFVPVEFVSPRKTTTTSSSVRIVVNSITPTVSACLNRKSRVSPLPGPVRIVLRLHNPSHASCRPDDPERPPPHRLPAVGPNGHPHPGARMLAPPRSRRLLLLPNAPQDVGRSRRILPVDRPGVNEDDHHPRARRASAVGHLRRPELSTPIVVWKWSTSGRQTTLRCY